MHRIHRRLIVSFAALALLITSLAAPAATSAHEQVVAQRSTLESAYFTAMADDCTHASIYVLGIQHQLIGPRGTLSAGDDTVVVFFTLYDTCLQQVINAGEAYYGDVEVEIDSRLRTGSLTGTALAWHYGGRPQTPVVFDLTWQGTGPLERAYEPEYVVVDGPRGPVSIDITPGEREKSRLARAYGSIQIGDLVLDVETTEICELFGAIEVGIDTDY